MKGAHRRCLSRSAAKMARSLRLNDCFECCPASASSAKRDGGGGTCWPSSLWPDTIAGTGSGNVRDWSPCVRRTFRLPELWQPEDSTAAVIICLPSFSRIPAHSLSIGPRWRGSRQRIQRRRSSCNQPSPCLEDCTRPGCSRTICISAIFWRTGMSCLSSTATALCRWERARLPLRSSRWTISPC